MLGRKRTLLLVLLALVLLAEFTCIEAKKKKKSKAKPVEEKKEDSAPKEQKEEKKHEKKPWSKMTKEDWERLENEPADEDDVVKPPEPPKATFDPSNPTAFMKAGKKGKPAMLFATLKGNLDKKATEDMSFKWKNLMSTAALDATPYVLENSKILWTVMDGAKGYELIDFCMSQPETEVVEWDQQKYFPEHWTKTD